MADFVHPRTRGERPPDLDKRLQYGMVLLRLAAEDPEAHRLMMEVTHLIRPYGALRKPELADRVMELMKAAA